MIFKVEVLAIYEALGTAITTPRRNLRDSDFSDAQSRVAAVGRFNSPDEFLDSFDTHPKYGFGWKATQFISARQDGDDIGRAIAARLATRSVKPGSYVQVFEHLADEGNPYGTGAIFFEQRW